MTPSERFRVAVITPYYRESDEILRNCYESVRSQTHSCTHYLVSDGSPNIEIRNWPGEHIILPRPHRDNGNTPRAIGSLSAMNQGYDAIAYLDADNWFYPDHVESMVSLHRQTGAAVCTAARSIHRLDGTLLYTDQTECDGRSHVDTSCLFLTRSAFRVLPLWAMMPPQMGPCCDRIIWQSILARRLSCVHNPQPTVAFRSCYEWHYKIVGESLPQGMRSNSENTKIAADWWASLPENKRNEWLAYFSSC